MSDVSSGYFFCVLVLCLSCRTSKLETCIGIVTPLHIALCRVFVIEGVLSWRLPQSCNETHVGSCSTARIDIAEGCFSQLLELPFTPEQLVMLRWSLREGRRSQVPHPLAFVGTPFVFQ